jgi:DNA repair exonuclease SbcCD ATPase subunit
LMGHVSRYLKEKGYGVTNQDIIEIFNGERIQAVDDELALAHSELMKENKRLEALLKDRDGMIEERDRVIAQNIEDIKALKIKNESGEKESAGSARNKKSYEAEVVGQAEMREIKMEAEISELKEKLNKLLLLLSQMPGAVPVEPTVRLANTPGTLFVEAPSPGSGRYGSIPMDSLDKDDVPTPNRPN